MQWPMVVALVSMLLMELDTSVVQARRGGRRAKPTSNRRLLGDGSQSLEPKPVNCGDSAHPEVRAWMFERIFTPEQCAQIEELTGNDARGGIRKGSPGTYEAGNVAAEGVLRSTALRWLPRSPKSQWLYDKVLALAGQADRVASDSPVSPWGYGVANGVSELQQLQLGMYSADDDPPGFYDWHADEELQQ